jgi:hypothetical protein
LQDDATSEFACNLQKLMMMAIWHEAFGDAATLSMAGNPVATLQHQYGTDGLSTAALGWLNPWSL